MDMAPAALLALALIFTGTCKAQDSPPGGVIGGRPFYPSYPSRNDGIPEPSSTSLFLLGAAVALALRNRR
jgi:hypothetical protein